MCVHEISYAAPAHDTDWVLECCCGWETRFDKAEGSEHQAALRTMTDQWLGHVEEIRGSANPDPAP